MLVGWRARSELGKGIIRLGRVRDPCRLGAAASCSAAWSRRRHRKAGLCRQDGTSQDAPCQKKSGEADNATLLKTREGASRDENSVGAGGERCDECIAAAQWKCWAGTRRPRGRREGRGWACRLPARGAARTPSPGASQGTTVRFRPRRLLVSYHQRQPPLSAHISRRVLLGT